MFKREQSYSRIKTESYCHVWTTAKSINYTVTSSRNLGLKKAWEKVKYFRLPKKPGENEEQVGRSVIKISFEILIKRLVHPAIRFSKKSVFAKSEFEIYSFF